MNDLILNIIAILLATGGIGALYYLGKKKLAKSIILALVIDAEEYWGSGMGLVKLTEVISKAYQQLPQIVKIFVTESKIKKWIEAAVQFIKSELVKDPETGASITLEKCLSKGNLIIE